jgi:hypothetical protein
MIINSKLTIIVLSVFLGLSSGIAGGLFVRGYLIDEVLSSGSNLNLSSSTGLIFRNSGKVVIEQNAIIAETINSVQPSLVGVYKKIA